MSPEEVSRSPRFKRNSRSPVRKSGELNQGRSSRSPLGSPANKGRHDPSMSNQSQSPNGAPTRIRKGRGFTDRYAFARRYRTPSPERSPRRSYHYGGRNINGRNRDRYAQCHKLHFIWRTSIIWIQSTFMPPLPRLPSYRSYSERSPPRRYISSPRGRSPPRFSLSPPLSVCLSKRTNYVALFLQTEALHAWRINQTFCFMVWKAG